MIIPQLDEELRTLFPSSECMQRMVKESLATLTNCNNWHVCGRHGNDDEKLFAVAFLWWITQPEPRFRTVTIATHREGVTKESIEATVIYRFEEAIAHFRKEVVHSPLANQSLTMIAATALLCPLMQGQKILFCGALSLHATDYTHREWGSVLWCPENIYPLLIKAAFGQIPPRLEESDIP